MFTEIDGQSPIPFYRQIADQIRRGVAAGVLAPGDQLPPVRELAARLLVNPNTVARCYRDLELQGLLETRRGEGTYIAQGAAALAAAERLRLIGERVAELAHEIRAYGISPEAALKMLRDALDSGGAGEKESR